MNKLVMCFSVLILTCTASYALDRPLPMDAHLAKLSPSANPRIVIDGKERILAAGAQIRDQNNRIVMPMSLSGPDVPILYNETNQTQINHIWILTNEEAKLYSSPALKRSNTPQRLPGHLSEQH